MALLKNPIRRVANRFVARSGDIGRRVLVVIDKSHSTIRIICGPRVVHAYRETEQITRLYGRMRGVYAYRGNRAFIPDARHAVGSAGMNALNAAGPKQNGYEKPHQQRVDAGKR